MTAEQILDKYSTPEICAQALENVLGMLDAYTARQVKKRVGMYFRCEKETGELVHEKLHQEGEPGCQSGLDHNVKRKIKQSRRTELDGADLHDDQPEKYQVGDFPWAGCIYRNGRYYGSSGRNQRMDDTMSTGWANEELHLCTQMMSDEEKKRPYETNATDGGIIAQTS
jgi:hypothetical protein